MEISTGKEVYIARVVRTSRVRTTVVYYLPFTYHHYIRKQHKRTQNTYIQNHV